MISFKVWGSLISASNANWLAYDTYQLADMPSNVCSDTTSTLEALPWFGATGYTGQSSYTGFRAGTDTSSLFDGYAKYYTDLEPFRCSDGSFDGVAVALEPVADSSDSPLNVMSIA